MKEVLHFLESYFFFIWLAGMTFIVSMFVIKGRKSLKEFGEIDASKVRFEEKFASGYSTKSWKTKRGGASRTLHIIITDEELILKTFLFFAYVAKRYDLLHRIPLENIQRSELRRRALRTELLVTCTAKDGKSKKFVLVSAAHERIKEILDEAIRKNETTS